MSQLPDVQEEEMKIAGFIETKHPILSADVTQTNVRLKFNSPPSTCRSDPRKKKSENPQNVNYFLPDFPPEQQKLPIVKTEKR